MSSPNLTFKANPEDLVQIKKALDAFEIAVQDKIVRMALRRFNQEEARLVASINRRYLDPSQAKGKAKIFKGGTAWGSVAYPMPAFGTSYEGFGRARRKQYDAAGVGWRSHFTELGFHTWAKGMMHAGRSNDAAAAALRQTRGKAWKKGLKHRGRGVYHRGTRASELAHKAMTPKLLPYLTDAIHETLVRLTKQPRRARR
jgi:hypothetical protein